MSEKSDKPLSPVGMHTLDIPSAGIVRRDSKVRVSSMGKLLGPSSHKGFDYTV